MKNSRFANLAVLVLVNLMWAAQYPAYKYASDRMDVGSLNFWTFVLSIALLLPFFLRERSRRKVDAPKSTGGMGRSVVEFTILGALGILPPSVMLSWGIAHSNASNGAILSLTIPVIMVGLAWLMLGEKLTLLRIFSVVLALVGTVLISRADLVGGKWDKELLLGNVAIFLAGAGSAFYNVYGKRLLERFTELELLVYSYLVAVVGCGLYSAFADARPFWQIGELPALTWLCLAVLGGLSWGLAMVLWMWALTRLAVGQVSASIYLLSFFGVALSAVTLGEKLGALQWAGGALVVAGTVLTCELEAWFERRRGAGTPTSSTPVA